MTTCSVCVESVSKTYGTGKESVHALKHVDLCVHENELLLIVGPSGSGKTTLLSVIAGTLHFDSGKINVLGYELETTKPEVLTKFRAYNIGFIFQEYHLIPTLTCMENVAIPLLIQNTTYAYATKRAYEVLEQVGLLDKVDRLPKELSGGQKQRVAIARALVHAPQVLICDEPTASLDHDTGIKIMQLLQEISQSENRSVIVVTHDHRIFSFANRVVEMDDGRISNIIKN
jgi:putative ABC transport system ATP-binding protein